MHLPFLHKFNFAFENRPALKPAKSLMRTSTPRRSSYWLHMCSSLVTLPIEKLYIALTWKIYLNTRGQKPGGISLKRNSSQKTTLCNKYAVLIPGCLRFLHILVGTNTFNKNMNTLMFVLIRVLL